MADEDKSTVAGELFQKPDSEAAKRFDENQLIAPERRGLFGRMKRKPRQAFEEYYLNQAQQAMAMGSEAFAKSPEQLAREAAAGSAELSGQAASQAQAMLGATMGQGGQQVGAVAEGIGDLGEKIRDNYYQNYAGASAADRQAALKQSQQAISQGQVAAQMQHARKKQQQQLALALMAGAAEGVASMGLGSQPANTGTTAPAPTG